MKRTRIAAWTVMALSIASPLLAEVPPLKEEELREKAQLVVVGSVKGIKTREVSPQSGFVNINYTLTVSVQSVEKGQLETDDKSIVVHAWSAKKRPSGWAGPGGHYALKGDRGLAYLKKGSGVQLFLQRKKDGTYDILSPNGFTLRENRETEKKAGNQ
jgi:hypothetical protein